MGVINRAGVGEIIMTGSFAVNDVIGTLLTPYEGQVTHIYVEVDTGPSGGDAKINYRLNGGAGELGAGEEVTITDGQTQGSSNIGTVDGGLNVPSLALMELYYQSGPNAIIGARIRIQFREKRGHFRAIKQITQADSPYAINPTIDQTILADSTAGNITIVLPAIDELETDPAYDSGGPDSLVLIVQKTVAANTVTIDGFGTETIQGATTKALSAQWSAVALQAFSDGWHILAETQGSITEEVQDIVGAMVQDSNTIQATYDDGTGTETLDVHVGTFFDFDEQGSAPGTPTANDVRMYAKNGHVYIKDDAGVEIDLASSPLTVADSTGIPTVNQVDTITLEQAAEVTDEGSGNVRVRVGQYRDLVYTVSGGDFSFLTDSLGNPIYVLKDLE